MPKISVILATYNDEKYIRDAIDSILNQTHEDLELIIVDDGSTDSTYEIINSFQDTRVIYLKNGQNRGLPYSLNRGLKHATGDYIARMDGDDISLPTRMEEQLRYLEEHKEVAICGCLWKSFGRSSHLDIQPEDMEGLKVKLLFYSPLAHSSWFIRASVIREGNLKYNTSFRSSQDYEFLYRLQKEYNIACVQKVLLNYRVHAKSITGQTRGVDKNTMRVQKRILQDLGIKASYKELQLLNSGDNLHGFVDYLLLRRLFRRIISANKKHHIFVQDKLENELQRRLSTLKK